MVVTEFEPHRAAALPRPVRIAGGTRLFFVVADPVAQVKAPEVWNHLFAGARANAVAVPAQVRAEHLSEFVRQAMALGNAAGLVVSIPHKPALARLVDRLDAAAEAAGAVNAVRRASDGALEGALFDGLGFVGSLRQHGVATAGRRVLLVGSGGAGVAIASALAAQPLETLAAFDTDAARAHALVKRVGPQAAFPMQAIPRPDPADFDVVVNATPLGLRPDDPLPFDTSRLAAGATVLDILMTAQPTALVRACRLRGVAAHSGHEMLLQQMSAYMDFFGFDELAGRLRAAGPEMNELRALLRGAPATP